MLYAKEVMELMGPYPGRQYRMSDIVRYVVGQKPERRRRNATREAIRQVLKELERVGTIAVTEPEVRGSFHLYAWKIAQVQDDEALTAS